MQFFCYNFIMNFIDFTAGSDDADRRLDKLARKFLNEKSLSLLYKSIRSGLIKINGKKAKPESKVNSGDIISVADFLLKQATEEKTEFSTTKKTLDKNQIIFQNEHILILNKPYNIPVQKAHKEDLSLDQLVKNNFLHQQKEASLSFTPGPLHRLDKKTTGLIAFSQSLKGARWFSEGIKNHSIKKIYLGIVKGRLNNEEKWNDRISRDREPSKNFKTVIQDLKEGKDADTIAIPLNYGIFEGNPVTLVQFNIGTGRTHQIRFQSSLHGHPLLGDSAYKGGELSEKKYGRNFFLHAAHLSIPADNPLNLPLEIDCPVSDDFLSFLQVSLINESFSLKI